jgi:hypothetical protein
VPRICIERPAYRREFRIDGGTWTSGPVTINYGQTLQLRS